MSLLDAQLHTRRGLLNGMTQKQSFRRLAYLARRRVRNAATLSRRARQRLLRLDAYKRARTVMWYVDCKTELQTQLCFPYLLKSSQRVCVPFCTVDDAGQPLLGIWQLRSLDELEIGAWGILEPPPNRWLEEERRVEPTQLDCIVVPGVAYSRSGDRLGNGQGYYDRLLANTRTGCLSIGLVYESQVFDAIPTEAHDIPVDIVVSDSHVYSARQG